MRGDAADGELGQLDARLARLDVAAGDPEVGLERLEEARASRAEAERARADLDRETPNWRERVAEADRLEAQGEAIELSDDRRVELRRRGAELQEEANGLRDERGGLSRDVQEMEALPGPAHVQGAIEEANAELEETFTARTTGWRCWPPRSPPPSGPIATRTNRPCSRPRAATWPASPTGATTG